MIRRVERRVAGVRLATWQQGFPFREDTLTALEWLSECVEVREVQARTASLIRRPGAARSLVLAPRCLTGQRLTMAVLEELAHFLLDTGLGGFLLRSAIEACDPRMERLARTVEMTEEAQARAFVIAWHLPSDLMARYRDDVEVSVLSRCSVDLIRRRREDLAGEVISAFPPPEWSAYWHYVPCHRSGALCAVEIGPVVGGEIEFAVPATPDSLELLTDQAIADSIALTVDEFRLKYRRYLAGPRICVRPTGDLLARALQRGRLPMLQAG